MLPKTCELSIKLIQYYERKLMFESNLYPAYRSEKVLLSLKLIYMSPTVNQKYD